MYEDDFLLVLFALRMACWITKIKDLFFLAGKDLLISKNKKYETDIYQKCS